jgi:pre-mRNA 3'-end-processing factor FIP1
MDVDEDDDFYAPEDGPPESSEQLEKTEDAPESSPKPEEDEDLEEGEEDEDASEGSDSVWPNTPFGGKRTHRSCRI